MFKIEKGIPAPQGQGGRRSYPFNDMNVGDSFFVEGDPHRPRAAASLHGRKYGKKFVAQKRVEDGVKGVRVWRIE